MKTFKCQEIGVILLGSFILAASIFYIQAQNNLAEGGFLGIALILKNLFHISPSITTLVLDIPIIIFSWKILGSKMVVNTLIGSISFSIFYTLLENHSVITIDLSDFMLLAAVLGGVLVGVGLGIILKFGGATGGDDILSILLSKYTGFTVGQVFLVLDLIVLALSLFYLSWMQVGYTVLSLVICSRVMDMVYYAKKPAKISFNLSKQQATVK